MWVREKKQHIPFQGTVFLRLSDSVLDTSDFPIIKLAMVQGVCKRVEVVKEGAHSTDGFLDKSRAELQSRVDYDPTGEWPETYTTVVRRFE